MALPPTLMMTTISKSSTGCTAKLAGGARVAGKAKITTKNRFFPGFSSFSQNRGISKDYNFILRSL
jgi:hypothetical protein